MTSNVITIGSTTVIHNGSNMRIYKPKLDPSQRDSIENSFIDTFYNKLTEERGLIALKGDGYLLTFFLENSKIYFQINILDKSDLIIYFNDDLDTFPMFKDDGNYAEKYLTKFFYNHLWSSK